MANPLGPSLCACFVFRSTIDLDKGRHAVGRKMSSIFSRSLGMCDFFPTHVVCLFPMRPGLLGKPKGNP